MSMALTRAKPPSPEGRYLHSRSFDTSSRPMPDITFILADGSALGFEAPDDVSLMQAATGFGVPGIVAECGGSALCATCHVHVDAAWAGRLPAASADEEAMLACTAAPRGPTSRLSCQIRLGAALQGLVVRVPERQY